MYPSNKTDLFDCNPNPIIIYDCLKKELYCNGAALAISKNWEDLLKKSMNWDKMQPLNAPIERVNAFEYKELYIDIILSRQEDNVVFFISTVKKVSTEQERYQKLVETSGNFIYQSDFQGNFTYINEVGVNKIGFAKQKIIGMNFSELIVAEKKQEVIDFYKKQFDQKTKQTYFEFPINTASGEIMWIGQTVQMVMNNKWVQGFQAYASDITERKKLQDQLLNQSLMFGNILDSLPVIVYLKASSGEFVFINGSPRDENIQPLTKEKVAFLKNFEDDDSEVWNTQKSVEKIEKLILKGKNRYFLSGKKIIQSQHDAKAMMLGYVLDITDRKLIEEDLRKTKQKAQKSNATKDMFISVVSHQIRTPMQAIMGISSLMLQEELGDRHKEYLKIIKTSSDNLIELLNKILDISGAERGEIYVQNKRFNLKESLAKFINNFKLQAASKNIILSLEIENTIAEHYVGDEQKLLKILSHIVSNAINYTKTGYVKIKVNQLDSINKKQLLNFTVLDTGSGMSSDYIERILEGASSSKNQNGYSISVGLSIAKQLIEFMGGSLEINSKVGEGTEVRIILGLELDQSTDLGSIELKIHSLNGLNILVVEDNEMNTLVLKKYLENKGVNVSTAKNGKEAIETILSKSLDMVLMDLQMPEMDGWETTKYIRKKIKVSPNALPIIAVTASTETNDPIRMSDKGFNAVLVKPFDATKLYDIIAKNCSNNIVNNLKSINLKVPEHIPSKLDSNVDLSYLMTSSGNNLEFVRNMVIIFTQKTPAYLTEIKESIAQNDYDKLYQIVHKMKPTTVMMGMKVSSTIEKIEYLAKNKIIDAELIKLSEKLCQRCETAIATLSRYLQTHNSESL